LHTRRLLIIVLACLGLAAPADASITRGWTPTGSMNAARTYVTGVVLDDGRVLVAGGVNSTGALRSAEIWDPATGVWSFTGAMNERRSGQIMVKLRSGKVLVAGGSDGTTVFTSAEVFDPATGGWTGVGAMPAPHHHATAALLPDGRVLVAGGVSDVASTVFSNSSEVFDPARNIWTSGGTVPGSARTDAAMVRFGDHVMLAGGYGASGFSNEAAIYDNGWRAVRPFSTARNWITLSPLPAGKVLAAGGATASATYSAVTEVYDSLTDTWATVQSLAHNHFAASSTPLGNGKVLLASGYNTPSSGAGASSELFDPVTATWSPAGNLGTARWLHAALLLGDGRLLVAGGSIGADSSRQTAAAELWTPTTALVSDPALTFGALRIGAGANAGVQITNTGDSPLLTADFAIAGINPGDFGVSGDRCRVVAPGATCALDVRFAPSDLGTRSATLTFSANTVNGVHAVPLSGIGTADTDGDGVLDGTDRCRTLKGSAARQGCPKGLLADPSISYRRSGKKAIRVVAYYVKATTGARVTVKCSRGCKRTITKGKGSKRVRIKRLNGKRLTNGTKITVTVSKPGRLTTTVVDRVSRGRRIEGRPRCTPVGC
jgi:hypothetical protein